MHPNDETLIQFVLREPMSESERESLQAHLENGCTECDEKLSGFEALVSTMQSDTDAEPPAAWVARAIGVFEKSSIVERIREWCSDLPERLGQVVFDSGADLALAGARHLESGRRLRFETDDFELDVLVEPVGKGGTLTGQIVRLGQELEPVANARYLVTVSELEMVSGTTDEFGEFTVSLARLGQLHVRAVVGEEMISFVVPEFPPPSE